VDAVRTALCTQGFKRFHTFRDDEVFVNERPPEGAGSAATSTGSAAAAAAAAAPDAPAPAAAAAAGPTSFRAPPPPAHQYQPPPAIYLAGYQRGDLAAAIFPGVATHCYFPSAAPLTPRDVLIVGMHGPARCGQFDPASCLYPGKSCSGSVDQFPGTVLVYNGEPHGRLSAAQTAPGKRIYYLGALAAEKETPKEMRVLHFALTCMVPFIEYVHGTSRLSSIRAARHQLTNHHLH
jgi:hypothetical protein